MIRTGLIWSGLAIALMAGVVVWAALAIPEGARVPLHWNDAGQADRWGDRSDALLILTSMPGAALVTSLVMALAPALDPFGGGLRRSAKPFLAIWLSVIVLFTAVTIGLALLLVRGAGGASDMGDVFGRAVIAGTGVLFLVLGNYLPKLRPSFFVGVRTPWTLTSPIAWEKTHRLSGKLFMAAGLVILVSAPIFTGAVLAVVVGVSAAGSAVASVVYSYFAWRSAPDKNKGPSYVS
ncbi:MAG: SdpI family protein [Pseudomonadota bacterium]